MRSDFCTALLRTCPCLTIYGNVYVGEKVNLSTVIAVINVFSDRIVMGSHSAFDIQTDSSTGSNSDMGVDFRDDLMLRDQKHYEPHYSIIRIDVPD